MLRRSAWRSASAIFFASGLLAGADTAQAQGQQCTLQWNEMVKAHATGAQSYRDFMVRCQGAFAPADIPVIDAPAGAAPEATGRCRDGVLTTATSYPQACAGHRGLAAIFRR